MWKSAREKFYASIPKECGMSDEKHELIKKLLEKWDDKSAAERREMSGGNHIFWRDKYRVIDGRLCYAAGDAAGDAAGEDEDALNIKQVSCVSTMYDDIKSVHVASACHSSLTLSHPVSPCLTLSHPVALSPVRRESQQGRGAVQGCSGQVREEHPSLRVLAVREGLPRLHRPVQHEEEESGGVPAHHHQGLRQAWPGAPAVSKVE